MAFLFGWSQLVLIRASAIGAISAVFSEYLLRSLGYDPAAHGTAADSIAAAAIVGTAAANIRGVRLGVALVGVSTGMKFAALALMVLVSGALRLGRSTDCPLHRGRRFRGSGAVRARVDFCLGV